MRPKPPVPLKVDWEMRDVSSAETAYNVLDDGRVEALIDHKLLRGVTAKMLVWWFQNFPVTPDSPGTMVYRGETILMYRIWHPRDHIRVQVMRQAPDGAPGLSTGARAVINERIGSRIATLHPRVAKMDEEAICLQMMVGPLQVAELLHSFTEEPEGTVYRSRLLVGPCIPIIGGLLARRLFPPRRAQEWFEHNVEEVGNLPHFLPKLYELGPERAFA